jgi:hypothetical protein
MKLKSILGLSILATSIAAQTVNTNVVRIGWNLPLDYTNSPASNYRLSIGTNSSAYIKDILIPFKYTVVIPAGPGIDSITNNYYPTNCFVSATNLFYGYNYIAISAVNTNTIGWETNSVLNSELSNEIKLYITKPPEFVFAVVIQSSTNLNTWITETNIGNFKFAVDNSNKVFRVVLENPTIQ